MKLEKLEFSEPDVYREYEAFDNYEKIYEVAEKVDEVIDLIKKILKDSK